MKYLFSFFVLASLLSSCNFNSKNNDSESYLTHDTIIHFSGYWISENYLENIKKYKSPKLAQFGSKYLVIPNRTLKSTQLTTNFNEKGRFLTVLKHNDKYELWTNKEGEAGSFVNQIVFINPKKILIDTVVFDHIYAYATDKEVLILESILFKGNYLINKNEEVKFENNGTIKGWNQYKYYSVPIDYENEAMQVDQIKLSKDSIKFENFGFKFNKNYLELYKLKCNLYDSIQNTCKVIENDKLVYRFQSIKSK